MRPILFSFLLVVGSNLLYHASQKSIPAGAHPVLSLTVTYVVALVVTLLLWPLYPGGSPGRGSLARLNWASAAVGVAIVGIEFGFLLAYRSGWRVSVGATAVNVVVAALLVPTGLLLFGEKLSAANVIGLVLCAAGLLLLVHR
jgi:uncharacterized membrane protein